MSSIRIWQITSNRSIQIEFPHHSSLDAITRQLPDGYYSTFRTFGNGTRVVGLKTHLQRLYHPVHSPDASEAKLREQLAIFLASYSHEARVRVIMTKQGQLYVMIESLKKLAPEIYEYGVRVETTEMARSTPRLKTTAFISASEDERKHIAHEGIFEALMVKNGEIIEGMTSNFFYILHPERSREAAKSKDTAGGAALRLRSEVLCTAQRDILLGVTRRMVLRVARASRLEVRYQPLKRDQLEVSREAFITSSSRGVVPVVQIDNLIVGDGRPGQITKQLSAAYEAYVIKKAEIIWVRFI
jgi:branched-chain amino acid aminotransferase